MFDEVDRRFFERRAQVARERALAARSPSAAKAHEDLARQYDQEAQAVLSACSRPVALPREDERSMACLTEG